MSNFVNRFLKSSKSLKVLLLGKDRKIYTYFIIPEMDHLVLTHNGVVGRYQFSPDRVFNTGSGIDKRMPTVYLVEGNAGAVNPFDVDTPYDARLFEVAISNNLVKDIVKASDTVKNKFENIVGYITIAVVIFLVIITQSLSKKLDKINDTIENMNDKTVNVTPNIPNIPNIPSDNGGNDNE